METKIKGFDQQVISIEADFLDKFWQESWAYIKTIINVMRESVLILDEDLQVLTANETFYKTFQVESQDTEKKLVYELGNGQWDIPALRKLLQEIIPEHKFFKGFEVEHDFSFIGHKVMILNARRIYPEESAMLKIFPAIILLAMEDITDMVAVAETLINHTKLLEAKFAEKTKKIESYVEKLEKEIKVFKKEKQL